MMKLYEVLERLQNFDQQADVYILADGMMHDLESHHIEFEGESENRATDVFFMPPLEE